MSALEGAPERSREPGVAPAGAYVERRFLDLIRLIPAIVWEADGEDYRMTFVSERSRDLLGYDPEQWMSEPGFWETHLHPEDRDEAIAAADRAVEGVAETRIDYRFRAADGSYRWFHDAIRVMRDPRGQRRLVGVMVDVTERKELERRLAHAAAHDALTGLRNRGDLLAVAQALLDHAGSGVALLFFDLDGFKALNDRLGHAAGDEILRVVARRLERTIRPGDIVGRLGGDEFVVVVPKATPRSARGQADRLRRRVGEPIEVGRVRVVLRVSVGVAISRPDEAIDALLNRADQAMYRAKARSRGPKGSLVVEPSGSGERGDG